MDIHHYIKIFTGLLAILNPIGAVPLFVTLTNHLSIKDKQQIARTSSMTIVMVLLVVTFLGQSILRFFGISIDSFRVAGGILILMMAINMMNARRLDSKQTREEQEEASSRTSIAVVPIAIPMLSGPGTISTMIVYSNQSDTLQHKLILAAISVALGFTIFIILKLSPKLAAWFSKTGINIITRIMGLIMAATGVEFITAGLIKLLPGLS